MSSDDDPEPGDDTTAPTGGTGLAPTPARRLLVLTHRLPYPPDRGDRIRSYHLIRTLGRHFALDLACTSDEPVDPEHRRHLADMVQRLAIVRLSPAYSRVRQLAALVGGAALTPAAFYRTGLARRIDAWHRDQPFDAVLTFCTGMIGYARALQRSGGSLRGQFRGRGRGHFRGGHVLDLVDVDSAKWAAYAADSAPPLRWVYAAEARRLRRIEAGERDHFDAVTVVSQREYDLYRSTVGEHAGLHVVGNGVDTDYYTALRDAASQTLVFVGVLNYKPNVDAVVWFAEHVLPDLRQRLPDATFQIVGQHPAPNVQDLARLPGVEVIGPVPDVRVHLARAAAVVVPLRIARGVQNKVLEAMAAARAVLCSPQAAAGIDAVVGQHLLVADDPSDWVTQLEQLLTDRPRRRRIAQAARGHVRQHYTWDARLRPMLALLNPDAAS